MSLSGEEKKGFSITRGHYTVEKQEETKKGFSLTRAQTQKNNTGSGLGYVLGSAGLGLAGVVEGTYDLLVGGFHSLFGDRAYAKYLHEKDDVGGMTQRLNEAYNPGKVMKFLGDAATGVGQSSVFLVPYVGAPLFFTGAAGRGVTEASRTTGELGVKEYAYGITSSAMETAMEALVGAGGQIAGKAGTNITAKVFKTGGQKAASELVRAGVARQMLSGATGEFFEEFLGSFADTALQRAYKIDPNAEYSLSDAIYSGAVGFASGGFMSGVSASTRAAFSHRNGQKIISEGNAEALANTATVLQDQIKTENWSKFAEKSEVGQVLRDLNASLNAYRKLSESERTGTRAALYLGEIQANMAQLEMMRSVRAEADKISKNAEAYTDYATRLSGKTVTADDIRNDRGGIAGRLAALAWAGEFMNTESEGSRREAWIREQIKRYADGTGVSDMRQDASTFAGEDAGTDVGVTVGKTDDGIDYTINGYGDRFYELGGEGRRIMTATAEVNDDGATTYRVAFGKAGEPETSYRVMRKTYTEQELDTVASLAREDAEGFVKQFDGDDIASDTSETRTSGETSAETGTETVNTSGDTDGEESKTGETEEETDDKSRNKDTEERESKTSDNSDTSETRTSGEGSKTKAQFSISPETESGSPRDYDKPITISDVLRLREIIKAHGGERVSVNDFTSEDIQKAQKWAYKFWDGFKKSGVNPCISPFFRAWFGDWRAYDGKSKVKYIQITDSEIKKADIYRKTIKNNDTGWDISVNSNGIDETANKNGKWSLAYHSLANIKEMLANAVLLDSFVVDEPSGKMDSTATFIHHLYCPVELGSDRGIAKLYVTENISDEHKFYLTKIEMESTDSVGANVHMSSADSTISIAEIFEFVKRNNEKFEGNSENPSKFRPKSVNPLLLNKDGTPRVFHHGTALENGDFTVFDESKAKKKLGLGIKALGKGNYFTSVDLKNNGRYGKGRIIDAYLHLTQPVIVDGESYQDVVNRILNDDISKYSDDDVQKMLRDKGYDGVILVTSDGNRIVNVFDSENIKSATDNIGTFDGGNKDIRYSIAPDNDSAGEQSGYTAAPGNASEDEQAGYNAKEQDAARRYVRDFDALPYETRASVYEFLRSAKGTKADEKTLAAISAIIAASPDLDVRFTGTSRSKPGLIVKEGNAKRQLILLSRDISDTAAIGRTLTAELIHRAENSMAYKALAREVMKNTTESERHAVEERYKDFWTESGEHYTKNDIAFEVVSECGADLMSDYNAVRAFATANSSAVRKILETARSICRSLFGKDREAYRRARELTSILAAALDQASALSDSGVSFQYSFDEKAQFSFDGKKSDTTKTDQIRTEAQQTHYLTKDASLDHITGWIKSLAGDREIFGNGRDLNSSAAVLPEGARLHVKNAGEMANKLYLAFYKGMAKNIARDSAALGKIIAENVLVLTGEGKKGTERRTLAEVFGNEAPAIESKIADFMAKKVSGILNGEDAYSYYEQIHADYEAQLRRAQQRFAERETEWQAAMATGNETFKQTLRSIQQILSARDKYKGPYKRKGLLAAPEMDALTEIISKSYSRGRLVPENVRRSLAQFVGFYEATDTREQINAEAAMLNISTDNIRDVCTAAKDLADLYELTDQNRMTADLTKDELTAFANTAAVVAQIYGHYNKYFDTRRKEWVDADANAEKGIKVVQRTIDIEQKQKLPGLKKVVKDFALSLLDPLAVGRMIDGFSTDGVMGEIMEDIVDAENARDARVIRYLKPIRDFLDEHKDYTKRLTAADQMIEFKGTKMTVDEFIQLWMTAHREQALLHLGLGRLEIGTHGGRDDLRVIEPALKADADVSLDERKAPKIEDLMDASQKVAQEIISLGDRVFTDEDREFIALQEKFYNEVASRDKAEADMLFFGMTNVGEKYYIPIVTSDSSRASSVVDARAMMSSFTSLSGQSFNKNTLRGAKNPLSITGSLGVLQKHAQGLASYIELYAPMQKLDRIWNTDINHNAQDSLTLRDTAKTAYGDNVHNYLTSLAQDIQGINRKEKNAFETAYARLRSRYAVYQLGLNPKSMVNQLGSLGAIARYIAIPNILKGLSSVTDVEEMAKYSTAAAIRNDGSVKVSAASNSEVIHGKISDFLMSGLGWADVRICAMMWGAAQHQILQDQGLAIGSEENKVAAGKLLNRMINEVQDTSIASTKTGLARTQNELFKGLTMFKSAPMKQISRLTEAAGALSMLNARKASGEDISSEQISAAQKELRMTVSGFVLQAALGVASTVLFNFLYNKEQESGKEIAIDFVGQMISVVPVISEIYDKITSGYDATSFAYDMINETTSAVTSTAKLTLRGLSGDRVSRQDVAKLVYQDAQVVGQFTGMPVRNAYNMITGLVRRLIPSTLGYSIDSATKTKNYNTDIRDALASGNTALANTAVNLLYADKKATSVISSAAASEVLRLYGLGFENVLAPTVSNSITVDGETYDLTASDLKKIRKIADGADGAVVSLIGSAIYSTLSDEAKSKAISKTYTAYYDRAISETFGTPVSRADAFARLGDSALIYSAAAVISGIESDKDASGKTVNGSRRKKAEEYLDTLGVSDSQRQLILYAAGYTSDEMKRKVLATVSSSDISDDDYLDVVAALNLE